MIKKLILATVAGALGAPALAQEVVLEDAWVRALPPVKNVTAAYLTVINNGDETITVSGARADVAGRVEIHRSREVDGYMRMEQLQDLPVAAGERLELAPGGTHLMLLDLKKMPQPGDTVQLCLRFTDGTEACAGADTRKSAGEAGNHHHH